MNLPQLATAFAALLTHSVMSFAAAPVDAAPTGATPKAATKPAVIKKPCPAGSPDCRLATGRGLPGDPIIPKDKLKLNNQNAAAATPKLNTSAPSAKDAKAKPASP
jgi:hypothetical protein